MKTKYLSGIAWTLGSLTLSSCTQDFGVSLEKLSNLPAYCLLADGSVVPSADGDCSTGGGGPPLRSVTETFSSGDIQTKKIDLVLVIDNSGSMYDEQMKVKSGLTAAGAAYFSNPNVDVCLWVLSSSRYSVDYQLNQSFSLGCSNNGTNAGSLTTALGNKIDLLGIDGANNEQLGKSLITYLADKVSFHGSTNSVESSSSLALRSGFRADATKAIVFATDENNYFAYSSIAYNNPSSTFASLTREGFANYATVAGNLLMWNADSGDWNMPMIDLPAITGQMRRASANQADISNLVADSRTGIKEYLGQLINLSKATVLNFLKLDSSGNPASLSFNESVIYSLAMGATNLHALKNAIGNGSINASIDLDAAGYTSQFQNLFENSVSIQSRFPLTHTAATSLGLKVVRVRSLSLASVPLEVVLPASDYSLVENNTKLQLSASAAAALISGDQIRITYFYE